MSRSTSADDASCFQEGGGWSFVLTAETPCSLFASCSAVAVQLLEVPREAVKVEFRVRRVRVY